MYVKIHIHVGIHTLKVSLLMCSKAKATKVLCLNELEERNRTHITLPLFES